MFLKFLILTLKTDQHENVSDDETEVEIQIEFNPQARKSTSRQRVTPRDFHSNVYDRLIGFEKKR